MFYKLWTDSENGKNTFIRCSVDWSDVPGRNAQFKKDYIKNTSERQWRQEFECVAEETLVDVYDTITNEYMSIPIHQLYNNL
jgi:hypothetical protein